MLFSSFAHAFLFVYVSLASFPQFINYWNCIILSYCKLLCFYGNCIITFYGAHFRVIIQSAGKVRLAPDKAETEKKCVLIKNWTKLITEKYKSFLFRGCLITLPFTYPLQCCLLIPMTAAFTARSEASVEAAFQLPSPDFGKYLIGFSCPKPQISRYLLPTSKHFSTFFTASVFINYRRVEKAKAPDN